MSLAFYAPMKQPNDPVPSGDRSIARGLIAALEHAGASVTLASTFKSRDGRGDAAVQAKILDAAKQEIARIIPNGEKAGWEAWITYHNYYKAPDLIGPAVSDALGIPYLQIESTRARKRLTGPWSHFAQAAEQAADSAAAILYFTAHDAVALKRDAPVGQAVVHLRPFLNHPILPYAYTPDGPLLCVGMMRSRDKLRSYQLIAETLSHCADLDWTLQIVGDGPARGRVEALMAPFGDKVTFLGECDAAGVAEALSSASVFVWPGVNEAFGLSYLEAQAAGLPIVAQDRPGVRDVLPPGSYPAPETGAEGLARSLKDLVSSAEHRSAASRAAYENATSNHTHAGASRTLASTLASVGVSL